MRGTVGRLLLGFVGGFLISRLRAMPGGDAIDWAGVDPATSAEARYAVLVLFALATLGARAGAAWVLFLGLFAGYVTQGFAFGPAYGIPTALIVVSLVAGFVGRPLVAARAEDAQEEGSHPANLGECAGLFVAGAGVAVALEAVTRHVRLLGAGLAQDDTVFGAVFLALLTLGAAAFGPLASSRATRRLSFPLLLAATAAAGYLSIGFVDSVADGRGLRPFLERWGLRVNDLGTPRWDALFAAGAFVAPALLLGAAFAGARGRRSWPSALFGAAAGLFVLPKVLDQRLEAGAQEAEIFSAQLVPLALLVTLVGAALAALSEAKRRPRARYVTLLLIGLCGVPALVRTVKPLIVLAPWEPRLIMPFVAFERAAGLATVEPSPRGFKVATLDRHLLTPDADGVASENRCIADSFAVLPRREGGVRVLLVGLLTPVRATALALGGATEVDRTANWWRVMPRLEDEMFVAGEERTPIERPKGKILRPDEARERIADGAYDLVIAFAIPGDAPGIGGRGVPEKTTVVRWLGLEAPLAGVVNPPTTRLAGSDVEHAVVVSASGLDVPALGIVTNGVQTGADDPRRVRVLSFEKDSAVETPWTRLWRSLGLRSIASRASTFAAIARTRPDPLADALAAFYADQAASPPFENALVRVELEPATLERLATATSAGPLDPFLRTSWSWIAGVLVEKRDVSSIDRFLAPLASAHAPWNELEVALAHAELEGLDVPAALRRLEPVVARDPGNAPAWYKLGEAREIARDAQGAAEAFRHVCDLLPGARGPRRRLAMALTRAGAPEGRALVLELYSQDTHDEELAAFAGPGEPPPPPTAYTPSTWR